MTDHDDLKKLRYDTPPWNPEQRPVRLALFGKFLEELGELTAITSRCIIQGIDESEPETGLVNREALQNEIADVEATLILLCNYFELDREQMRVRALRKIDHLKHWHTRLETS